MIRFIDLPREVRDEFYNYALVRGIIDIDSTPPFVPADQFVPLSSDIKASIETSLLLSKDKTKQACMCSGCAHAFFYSDRRSIARTMRDIHTVESSAPTTAGTVTQPLKQSYCLHANAEDSPVIALLSTNRQLYLEASEIFYAKNLFNFLTPIKAPDSMLNCQAFLEDRPDRCLAFIAGVDLLIGDHGKPQCMQSGPEGPVFQSLCYKLSMKCRRKTLGLVIDLSLGYQSKADIISENWMEQLGKIKGLKELKVDMIGYGDAGDIAEFVCDLGERWWSAERSWEWRVSRLTRQVVRGAEH